MTRLSTLVMEEALQLRWRTRIIGAGADQQATLTVTAKGQVTLGKDVLHHLGVHPGEKIVVVKLPDGQLKMRAAQQAGSLSKFFGSLQKDDGICLSIEEIGEAAAKGWAGER